ncbi:MAG: energy transducer TonB [Betaproteobacteria bacterium]|nr:energy transducer TonB [Betaproteobacteria bacterium]
MPVIRPQTVRPQTVRPQTVSVPRQQAPVIEATRSAVQAVEAVTASPPDTRPAEPAVTQARFDADYLKNPAPPYPPLSRKAGEQGKVVLRVAVTAQGTAEQVEIRTSSGSQRLDDAALNTVRNWRFVPARRGDGAVPSSVLVPIIFKLEQ